MNKTELRSAWENAQIGERTYHETDHGRFYHLSTFDEHLEWYRNFYEGYFKHLSISTDLQNKRIMEIGPAMIPCLHYCTNMGQSYILEPCSYSETKALIANKPIEHIALAAEDCTFPKVDEIWLFNVLQHTIDPDLIIEKSKEAAKVVKFFEPIDLGTDPLHLHAFKYEYFTRHFGEQCTKKYTGEVKGFHSARCAYGIWMA